MRVGVHRCGVEDGDSVPAGLDLDGEMALEAMAGFDVAEDGFKRSVLEGGTVHVASDPAVQREGVSFGARSWTKSADLS